MLKKIILEPKYYKCEKCGGTLRKVLNPSLTDINTLILCTQPSLYRVMGICCGSVTEEITKEEYETQLKEWEIKNK